MSNQEVPQPNHGGEPSEPEAVSSPERFKVRREPVLDLQEASPEEIVMIGRVTQDLLDAHGQLGQAPNMDRWQTALTLRTALALGLETLAIHGELENVRNTINALAHDESDDNVQLAMSMLGELAKREFTLGMTEQGSADIGRLLAALQIDAVNERAYDELHQALEAGWLPPGLASQVDDALRADLRERGY
jgi:hypothetical protein